MRGSRGLLVLMAVAAAACGPGEAATTTTLGPTTTTTPTTTSTTTTTLPETTTTVAAVEGVPEEALALIGAPMPEVDLTIVEPTEAELLRWLADFNLWSQWLRANPDTNEAVLSVGIEPGSEYWDQTVYGLQNALEAGWRLLGAPMPFVDEQVEVAAPLFIEGSLQANYSRRFVGPSWVVDDAGTLIEELEEWDHASVAALNLKLSGESTWRVVSWVESP